MRKVYLPLQCCRCEQCGFGIGARLEDREGRRPCIFLFDALVTRSSSPWAAASAKLVLTDFWNFPR